MFICPFLSITIILVDLSWYQHCLFLLYLACPTDFSCLNGGTCLDGSCSCTYEFAGSECEKSRTTNMHFILCTIYCHILILSTLKNISYFYQLNLIPKTMNVKKDAHHNQVAQETVPFATMDLAAVRTLLDLCYWKT